jgi:hypothetical protein
MTGNAGHRGWSPTARFRHVRHVRLVRNEGNRQAEFDRALEGGVVGIVVLQPRVSTLHVTMNLLQLLRFRSFYPLILKQTCLNILALYYSQ